jgi:hypothetical protein
MVTVEPVCPAYGVYLAQSPARPVVAEFPPEAAVVAVVVLVPPDEHATRTAASAGAASDVIARRLPFDVIDALLDP